MAKFLNTSATNYFLEELIKTASDRLVLISPFLKLNDRIKELLEDKNRLKIDVRIVYGKSELQPEEINWLKELTYVRTSFCRNLHAKCYLNERGAIITSLNLYEFSQVNNNEMGVYVSRDDDAEIYKETLEEAQRIIRISDEIRISLEKVESGDQQDEETNATGKKLSTSRIAKQLKLSTADFLEQAEKRGWLKPSGDKFEITSVGEKIGGELVRSKRFGEYFVWPDNLEF